MCHDDDEDELLELCRLGRRTALGLLYDRHAPPVLRFFRNKAKSEDIEDLVQETMKRLFEKVDEIEPGRSIQAYVFGIANNLLREYLRKQTRTLNLDTRLALSEVMPSAGSMAVRQQQMRLFLRGLREIPLADQILLELHYFEGHRIKVIARDFLEIADSTARSRVEKARKRLKDQIGLFEVSTRLIESTIEYLDDWARDIRELLDQPLETPEPDDEETPKKKLKTGS